MLHSTFKTSHHTWLFAFHFFTSRGALGSTLCKLNKFLALLPGREWYDFDLTSLFSISMCRYILQESKGCRTHIVALCLCSWK